MKKIFNKLAVLLTVSSLTLPLTACVFNFYINSATNSVIKSFADQTSSVVKSLILAKEKNTDTSQTIQDILNEFPNSGIKNNTQNVNLNNLEEFTKLWGFQQKINISGFDINDYFLTTGSGELTKQVNNYKNMNKTFNDSKLLLSINIADNQMIYELIKNEANIKNTILSFLNETKKTKAEDFPDNLKTILTLLKNIVIGKNWDNGNQNAFKENIVDPLNLLLNYLIEGQWTENQKTTPSNQEEFKSFMDNWKDKNNKPYSQWNNNSEWKLSSSFYKKWTPNDFNFYRSGVLINYLFYKIGKDYQLVDPIKKNEYEDRYLGNIIQSHIKLFPKIDIDEEGLVEDLNQYLQPLLTNPEYIFLIIEAIIPIIKEWGLKMNDITKGIKNLTFGKIYPTNDDKNSYNILDVLYNIEHLLNNPKELEAIIKALIGWAPEGTKGRSFTYDIKIFGLALGDLMNKTGTISIPEETKQQLVNSVINLVNTDTVKGAFKNILHIFQTWIKQYDDKNEGINFDLTKLKEFLLNTNNGLITIINRDIIPFLYNVMLDSNPVNDDKYLEFYETLGGQKPLKPDQDPPINFKSNSLLELIKNHISKPNEPLGQIAYILFGNSSENTKGIFDFIIDSNNAWIYDNYKSFFDVNNQGSGKVYNLIMTTTNNKNIISDDLSYNFTYKINNHTYSFLIKCKSYDNKINFTGIKSFYFTDIELKNIK